MSHVLEHCQEPSQALEHAGRVLKPGGSLVVEVPNAESRGSKYFGTSWFHADYGLNIHVHANDRTDTSTREIFYCEPAGWSILDCVSTLAS